MGGRGRGDGGGKRLMITSNSGSEQPTRGGGDNNCDLKHRASDLHGSTLIRRAETDIFTKKESFNQLKCAYDTQEGQRRMESHLTSLFMNENAP
ncbi:hypothetical protein BT93_J1298 [Corymbia citriodora subsp. variegata]|nr:hypothetical protein BT93_J1298 [Corymbia citriodora subsp. variegata]